MALWGQHRFADESRSQPAHCLRLTSLHYRWFFKTNYYWICFPFSYHNHGFRLLLWNTLSCRVFLFFGRVYHGQKFCHHLRLLLKSGLIKNNLLQKKPWIWKWISCNLQFSILNVKICPLHFYCNRSGDISQLQFLPILSHFSSTGCE